MGRLKGLYIEDDPKNIKTYSEYLSLEGLEMISLEELPKNIEDYYDIILQNDIDFLLIDYHLDKQVNYSGTDVLKTVRKNDPTIYGVLLTNFDLEENYELGEYDYEFQKDEFLKSYKKVCEKIKRACKSREESEIVNPINENLKIKLDKEKEAIKLLEEIKAKLD